MQKATDGAVAHHVVQHTAFPARKPVEHGVVGAADKNVAPHLGQGLGQLACESRGDRDGRKPCDCERRARDALARRGGAEWIAGSASVAQGAVFDRNPCQANILTGKAHMCGKQRINRLCASERCEKEDAMLCHLGAWAAWPEPPRRLAAMKMKPRWRRSPPAGPPLGLRRPPTAGGPPFPQTSYRIKHPQPALRPLGRATGRRPEAAEKLTAPSGRWPPAARPAAAGVPKEHVGEKGGWGYLVHGREVTMGYMTCASDWRVGASGRWRAQQPIA